MREYIMSAETLLQEAERALQQYGLSAEGVALEFTRAAVRLIWNHADPNTDECLAHWITDRETYIKNAILDLHKQRIEKLLSV